MKEKEDVHWHESQLALCSEKEQVLLEMVAVGRVRWRRQRDKRYKKADAMGDGAMGGDIVPQMAELVPGGQESDIRVGYFTSLKCRASTSKMGPIIPSLLPS